VPDTVGLKEFGHIIHSVFLCVAYDTQFQELFP